MIQYVIISLKLKEGLKMAKRLKLVCFCVLLLFMYQVLNVAFAKELRRDPFVPLVDNQGNIRNGNKLFVPAEEVVKNIILKGILWDEKNPLAVINGKVLSEGSQIIINEGGFLKIIILKKIHPASIILNYNDGEFEVMLRKKEKEK